MKYRKDRKGEAISRLGYGCMRFTKKGTGIDYEKAEKEVMLAIENGVNYFGTAYIYPGSEACLGRILDENKCREYVDYYLMHMFTDIVEWERLKSLGIEDWIKRHKADGSIRIPEALRPYMGGKEKIEA